METQVLRRIIDKLLTIFPDTPVFTSQLMVRP